MALRPQAAVSAANSDESLLYIQQMGIRYVSLVLKEEELSDEVLTSVKKRLAAYGLEITDAAVMSLQKSKSIHLGLSDRDEWIEKFNNMLRVLSRNGIYLTSVAWQPTGIFFTKREVGEYTRGGVSRIVDSNEILSRGTDPNIDRDYTMEEIWENFEYFLSKVVPVAEECGMHMALHPNDPPLECMAGIPSLIYNTETYRKAFALSEKYEKKAGSNTLVMKLCIGCWLEGGEAFGNLLSDIKEFADQGRLAVVHFRNVKFTGEGCFEETLIEDGDANMFEIMKALVASDCDAVISHDHSFGPIKGYTDRTSASGYFMGVLNGLLYAAEIDLGKRTF